MREAGDTRVPPKLSRVAVSAAARSFSLHKPQHVHITPSFLTLLADPIAQLYEHSSPCSSLLSTARGDFLTDVRKAKTHLQVLRSFGKTVAKPRILIYFSGT